MKNITTDTLETVTGGAFGLATANVGTATKRTPSGSGSGSGLQLSTALTGVTSALDSLKQNHNKGGSIDQLLPLVVMARWARNG